MKIAKLFIPVLFCGLLFACTNDRKEQKIVTDTIATQQKDTASSEILSDIPWTATLDTNTQQYTMIKNKVIEGEVLGVFNVLEAINRKYPENKLIFERQNADTVFVKVEDAS